MKRFFRGRVLVGLGFLMLGLLSMIALIPLGCGGTNDNSGGGQPKSSGYEPVFFQDVTKEVGLKFHHQVQPKERRHFMPHICGSGVAVLDFNKDGLMDLYFVQNGGPDSTITNRLYQQMPDGTFKDVSKGSGLDIGGFNMGATVGDFNNDGLPDVLVTQYKGSRLFVNLGNGQFKDVTKEAGIDNPLWSTSAAFFDYDKDGWLDLFIVNYVALEEGRTCEEANGKIDFCSPKNYQGTASKLYRNLGKRAAEEGKAVLFEDVSRTSGIGLKVGPGLGIVTGDFNQDGWLDIFVANDGKPNFLWMQKPDKNGKFTGKFSEEGGLRGVRFGILAEDQANMGVAWADVDNDHLFDLFVTHLPHENNTLWRQVAKGQFQDATIAMGLGNPQYRATGWGATFQDFDNDGWLDLAIVNGRVSALNNFTGENWADFRPNYGDRNQVFLNEGKDAAGKFKGFRDISGANPQFTEPKGVYRALIWADLNNDGAMDLIATEINEPARVWRNVAPKRGNWLMIRCLEPTHGGRDAYGALLTISAGGQKWLREVNPCQSYLTTADPRVHVGLGKADKVDSIEVVWADGYREMFSGGEVNKHITLRKGEGKAVKTGAAK